MADIEWPTSSVDAGLPTSARVEDNRWSRGSFELIGLCGDRPLCGTEHEGEIGVFE
jgi:hypothetical protein